MRNEIIKEQFANSSARRVLGFGLTGAPALAGLVDLIPGQLRLLNDSNVNNKLELLDWIGGTLVGFSGTAPRTVAVPTSGIYTVIAWVEGLASDFSKAYASMLMATFRRPASGDEVLVGASTKIYEVSDVVGATSSISGSGGGGVSINFNSNQAVLQYTWSIKAIQIANVN